MDAWTVVLDFLVIYIGVWAFVRWVIQPMLQRKFDQELGDAKQILEELESKTLIPLQVETHGDEYLCYNSLTNDFVCQGRDIAEIMQRFHLRYPEKSAALHRGDEQALKVLKQQLKEYRESSSSIRSAS